MCIRDSYNRGAGNIGPDTVVCGNIDSALHNSGEATATSSDKGPRVDVWAAGTHIVSSYNGSSTSLGNLTGTSMATPGAAGVAVLMYQANPDLSPFDIRNIMQETSTYRECHYMLANEPCAEDAIPKNRQNNVYGHGHVNAQPAVDEAANYDYDLSLTLNVTLASDYGLDNRVWIGPGESIYYNLEGGIQRVQWRTWDMRDNWMDLPEFNSGDSDFEVSHSLLVDRLQYLPNNTIEGTQVILVRAISGASSSTNLATAIHISGEEKVEKSNEVGSMSGILIGGLSLIVIILLITLIFAGIQLREMGFLESEEYYDDEIEEVVGTIVTEDGLIGDD